MQTSKFKVAYAVIQGYTWILYDLTSQDGELNVLWNCLCRSIWLNITIGQCLEYQVCETQILSSNQREIELDFRKIIFPPKFFALLNFILLMLQAIFQNVVFLFYKLKKKPQTFFKPRLRYLFKEYAFIDICVAQVIIKIYI